LGRGCCAQRADGEVAMARGALPLRTWELSSAKVTSRTQCGPFSIVQCPRAKPARCQGAALLVVRLVTA
jgi:hypothetical protein